MPKSKAALPLSHADALAEAEAAWAEHLPPPRIALRPKIDYTARTFEAETGMSRPQANKRLLKLTHGPDAKFTSGEYRIDGRRQAEMVYWPIVAGPPKPL